MGPYLGKMASHGGEGCPEWLTIFQVETGLGWLLAWFDETLIIAITSKTLSMVHLLPKVKIFLWEKKLVVPLIATPNIDKCK